MVASKADRWVEQMEKSLAVGSVVLKVATRVDRSARRSDCYWVPMLD